MMPIARFEMPDGRIGRFEVPNGTTPEQAQEMIAAQVSQQPEQLEQAQPQEDSFFKDVADVGLEAAAGINKGVLGLLDFFTVDQVNAIGQMTGAWQPLPTLSGSDIGQAATSGGFMDDGLARDIVRTGGELVAPGVGMGGAIRKTAQMAAPTVKNLGIQSTGQALREQLTRGTVPADIVMSYGAGAGGEYGKEKGGVPGEIAGGVVGAMTAGGAVQAAKAATKPVLKAFQYQSPTKQKIGELIASGSDDISTARYELKPRTVELRDPTEASGIPLLEGYTPKTDTAKKFSENLRLGAPKIKSDREALESIKQGFDEGVIATIKGASPSDRQKMLEMVEIMQRGKKSKGYAVLNRPGQVAGDSLMERVKYIQKVNSESGKSLDSVAQSLKGKRVDHSSAINDFIDDLDSMGVTISDDLTPNFIGSDIEKVRGAESTIKNIMNRLKNTKAPDAYDVHRMKKYIDEQVTYGKSAKGLAGKTEIILKNLRRNLDKTLDDQFPEYNKVNETYSDTITAIDAIQDTAGRKMDLSGPSSEKAAGNLLRRLMSNYQSRTNLIDAIDDVERVAIKYGGKFDDDLIAQTLFVDELDSVFGPVARTSFQGQISQAMKQGVNTATTKTGAIDAAINIAGKGAEKVRGINEEAAFKAIIELLKK